VYSLSVKYHALKNVNFRSLAALFGRSLFNLAVRGRQSTDFVDSFWIHILGIGHYLGMYGAAQIELARCSKFLPF
jgi:hypothetical protein